jgi:RNA-directed DNA polymerase
MASPLFYIVDLVNSSDHSQDYKDLLISYSQNLASQDLPVIFDLYHLAYMIGIPPYRLINMIRDRELLYNTYKIRKKNGGYRWIMSPNEELKSVQRWILINILEKITISNSANAFVRGKSIVSNARNHIGKELILNIDLYRFFDTITEKRVFGLIKKLGYTDKLSYDIAKLLCVNAPNSYWKEIKKENRLKKRLIKSKPAILPQGAPTSPIISNIVSKNLDKAFLTYCAKCNIEYSRYADDLSFSGKRDDMLSLPIIKKIIRQQGFTINIDKTKYLSHHRRQTITGITVNNGLYVDKKITKLIKQELFYCLKYGYKDHLEYKKNKGKTLKSGYKDWLLVKICFIYSVEKENGEKLFKLFNQIEWGI